MLKVVLVGYGELASSLLLGIQESKHELVGVFRHEKVEYNPWILKIKDYVYPAPFYLLIKQNNIPEINARSVNSEQFKKEIMRLQPDVILIGSWGEILKKDIIILPKVACINCHPSMLPHHRGSNPYSSAIRAGEKITGVTFHLVDTGIDTGNILAQFAVKITDDDTGTTLRTRCAYTARAGVVELLDGIENGDVIPHPQDENIASYFPRISPMDVVIDWSKPAHTIYNQIRGLHPWTCCYTRYKDRFMRVESAKIVDLAEKCTLPAGTILSKMPKGLLVVTSDKNLGLHLENVEVINFGLSLFSSPWSRIFIKYFVKVGDVLTEV